MTMLPFPSINQFRHVVGQVRRKASFVGLDEAGEPIYNPAAKNPTLEFKGTVKLHGTNAAIVFSPSGITYQSRERELTLKDDNAGFMNHMAQHEARLGDLRGDIERELDLDPRADNTVAIFGEWCGGNIQKGVAINGLPKMFVIFAIKVNDEWGNTNLFASDASIYNINNFPTWTLEIDFEQVEVSQNELAALTEQVEACCPVGKALGNEGTGEGIVWRCTTDPNPDLWFKVKGEKQSASKVRTLALVDVEAVTAMRDFVERTVTEARLQQGLQNLLHEQRRPFDMTSIGDFIRWVYGDVIKEESDTLEASGLKPRNAGGPIAQIAKRWYVERMNEETIGATT